MIYWIFNLLFLCIAANELSIDEVSNMYREYLIQFKKDINSRLSDPSRLHSFEATLRAINEVNSNKLSLYRLGLNSRSDLTQEERRSYNGLIAERHPDLERRGKISDSKRLYQSPNFDDNGFDDDYYTAKHFNNNDDGSLSTDLSASPVSEVFNWASSNNPLGYPVTPPGANTLPNPISRYPILVLH